MAFMDQVSDLIWALNAINNVVIGTKGFTHRRYVELFNVVIENFFVANNMTNESDALIADAERMVA